MRNTRHSKRARGVIIDVSAVGWDFSKVYGRAGFSLHSWRLFSILFMMKIFGNTLSEGRHACRRGDAWIDYTVEGVESGYLVRGSLRGSGGTLEVFRTQAPGEFLVNNWQSWGPMMKMTPGSRIAGMEDVTKNSSPYVMTPIPGMAAKNLLSDYFLAWAGGLTGFLSSRIAHPAVAVEGGEIAGYLEYFGENFREPVPLEPLLILSGGGPVENLLDEYAGRVRGEHAVPSFGWNPVGWCSWYQYFERVSWRDILKNLELARGTYPFEVFQIDDGYERDIGDWLMQKSGWPALAEMARAIRSSAFIPGIWTAPFSAAETARLVELHPDWLVRERGSPKPCYRGWGKTIYALDTSHPGARDWLKDTFTALKEAGFRYFKIDFLFAAAMEGERRSPVTPIQAYRLGMEAIREAIGGDFILGCGAPLLPSVGFVDGMRIGEDTAPFWDSQKSPLQGPNACHALRNALMRQFMHRRLWLNDPDCLLLRDTDTCLTENERTLYALSAGILDTMIIQSDDLALVKPRGLDLLKKALSLRGGRTTVRGLLGDDCYWLESAGKSLLANLSDRPLETGGILLEPRSARLQEG
jgi:alpha-galactosidase